MWSAKEAEDFWKGIVKERDGKIEELKEYIDHLEHESKLLYGRLNNIIDLASKEIK